MSLKFLSDLVKQYPRGVSATTLTKANHGIAEGGWTHANHMNYSPMI